MEIQTKYRSIPETISAPKGAFSNNTLTLTKQGGGSVDIPFEGGIISTHYFDNPVLLSSGMSSEAQAGYRNNASSASSIEAKGLIGYGNGHAFVANTCFVPVSVYDPTQWGYFSSEDKTNLLNRIIDSDFVQSLIQAQARFLIVALAGEFLLRFTLDTRQQSPQLDWFYRDVTSEGNIAGARYFNSITIFSIIQVASL